MLWSIEDQISYPYIFWKHKIEDYRVILETKKLCPMFYPDAPTIEMSKVNVYGLCYVDHSISKSKYGLS
jgi:hypothetical protein